ncbi:hypothetical protein HN385_04265 [archaeon]|jgi:hypothetical protein|nr:hypothetical protein [archaeon]MBT3450457.1 hypothetical protein [archaeon]MBT6868986.1 hypothetical protein [archaeon]MBT7193252.1 hypothetical protein [archaeon]MBT7380107.1 hypothetical protein [archaeon]
MDIERIQKINNLALDLMRQGLAKDKDDAITQAEKIFRHDPDDYNSVSRDMHSNSLQVKQGQEESNVSENSDKGKGSKEQSELTQEKIESILERNTKYVVTKLKEFNDKVEKLESEMTSLKMEVNRCRSSMTSMQQRPVQQQQPVQQPTQQSAKQNSNSSHPRSGGYEEQDVSIEKFFYAGSK